jgi:Arc/MetJ-type ribon-helix-helix transcriptional regulator
MTKTSVYLPRELKAALARLSRQRGRSEAELVREAVTKLTGEAAVPPPRLPLFRGRGPSIAKDVDRALPGFGTQ